MTKSTFVFSMAFLLGVCFLPSVYGACEIEKRKAEQLQYEYEQKESKPDRTGALGAFALSFMRQDAKEAWEAYDNCIKSHNAKANSLQSKQNRNTDLALDLEYEQLQMQKREQELRLRELEARERELELKEKELAERAEQLNSKSTAPQASPPKCTTERQHLDDLAKAGLKGTAQYRNAKTALEACIY